MGWLLGWRRGRLKEPSACQGRTSTFQSISLAGSQGALLVGAVEVTVTEDAAGGPVDHPLDAAGQRRVQQVVDAPDVHFLQGLPGGGVVVEGSGVEETAHLLPLEQCVQGLAPGDVGGDPLHPVPLVVQVEDLAQFHRLGAVVGSFQVGGPHLAAFFQ